MSSESFEQIVAQLADPSFSVTQLIGKASAFQAAGDLDRAVLLYRLWIRCNPDSPFLYVAHFNLGTILSGRGDNAGAQTAFEAAIAIKADFYPAYVNLGSALERQGANDEAVKRWFEIINRLSAITADAINYKCTAIKQIGRVLESHQQLAGAENILRQGLGLDPDQLDVAQHFLSLRMNQCEWPVVVPWENVTRKALMKGFSPLSAGAYTDDPVFQLATAWAYNRTIEDPPAGLDYFWQQVERKPSKRLRIGYLSSDLREHAIGFLMAELFELHDRSKFEIFAYYCGIPQPDGMKTRIQGAVEHWIDITKMDDRTAAQRIAADNIDILIDVNGYTRDARTKVLTFRPAPVIVNWLGFPGTMASPYHHYLIADDWIVPEASEIYYTEKVLRLPCYQPNDRKRAIAERPTRKDAGLPDDAVVFCCFNGTQKFTRFTFERWMRILAGVPGSVLWLLSASEAVQQRLREQAAKHGIAPERLVFAAKLPNARHLARYQLADLFLDTFPYGAHTTASDALWLGVPVLTYSGRGFASRVCGSLVRSAGLPELICDGAEDYVRRAIALGNDLAALKACRDKLAANRDSCVLFDMDGHARALEALYQDMWSDFRAGRLPQPDLANLDAYYDAVLDIDHEAREIFEIGDYEGFYRDRLAARHKFRPIPHDERLWSAEAAEQAVKLSQQKDAAS